MKYLNKNEINMKRFHIFWIKLFSLPSQVFINEMIIPVLTSWTELYKYFFSFFDFKEIFREYSLFMKIEWKII